ncbi:MAG TPA: sigma factor, partial [Herpetosiphonaceae bacterium]|nr:sigma factor [Herpetosiphonaceae bacterium]
MSEAAIFNEYRPLLFSIAYRMLGSVMDAEDMVQEAFLRWQRTAEAEVQSPKAFLSTVITRLCLDQLRSA